MRRAAKAIGKPTDKACPRTPFSKSGKDKGDFTTAVCGSTTKFITMNIAAPYLGQELVTRAMDRMKVFGMGRLCFQLFAQPQNVVIDSPCTRIVLVSPHFIE